MYGVLNLTAVQLLHIRLIGPLETVKGSKLFVRAFIDNYFVYSRVSRHFSTVVILKLYWVRVCVSVSLRYYAHNVPSDLQQGNGPNTYSKEWTVDIGQVFKG
jgi:hypothetical protein